MDNSLVSFGKPFNDNGGGKDFGISSLTLMLISLRCLCDRMDIQLHQDLVLSSK